MGGAPPPPLGVAPQDPKKPEKFGRFRPDLGGLRGPRISVQDRGVAGAPNHYPPSWDLTGDEVPAPGSFQRGGLGEVPGVEDRTAV